MSTSFSCMCQYFEEKKKHNAHYQLIRFQIDKRFCLFGTRPNIPKL